MHSLSRFRSALRNQSALRDAVSQYVRNLVSRQLAADCRPRPIADYCGLITDYCELPSTAADDHRAAAPTIPTRVNNLCIVSP
jgi:hypothetical protein